MKPDWLDSQTPGKKNYILPGEQWGGTVDADVLTATWRVAREPRKFVADGRGERTTRAPEPAIMGAAYDPNSPRKYLRMHLPGQKGASFLTGAWVSAASGESRTDGEYLRQTHVVRRAPRACSPPCSSPTPAHRSSKAFPRRATPPSPTATPRFM